MGNVEKESSKSLPWVFGQEIQLVWLLYFGLEIWKKFLLGNEDKESCEPKINGTRYQVQDYL